MASMYNRIRPWVRVLVLALALGGLFIGGGLPIDDTADAATAHGVYTKWYDYYGGPQVGEEGTYCDGTYYFWGRRTTCSVRGDHCGIADP